MPLTIISRRNITYREPGRGEVTVLLVPGRDQIQVVKDLAGLGNSPVASRESAAKGAVAKKQVQLSRVHIGRRFIYGNLPSEISDLRQPVKVWLAEDFAPLQSQVFFYIFSSTVLIHGVREQDDEGFQNWRTAQLPLDETDPLRSMINAISDYALSNPSDNLTVAVQNKLDLYEKLQAGLSTYSISPIPFSKLKPQPNLKPLYHHRDYTVLFLTLALFGFITLLASAGYLAITKMNLWKLEAEVADVQSRIDAIKLNQNVGQITDPQMVLQVMSRQVNQQPSAIVDAAGSIGAELGTLGAIKALFTSELAEGETTPPPPGQMAVQVVVEKLNDPLLLSQEQVAASSLASRPWVREIKRGGAVGERGDLRVILQIDQAPESGAPSTPATAEPTPATSPAETNIVSGTQPVSTTDMVTNTTVNAEAPTPLPAASNTLPVQPSASEGAAK